MYLNPFILVLLFNEMNHFVTNFQYRGFTFTTCFSDEMDGAKYLRDLLLAQNKYLNLVLELLLSVKRLVAILGRNDSAWRKSSLCVIGLCLYEALFSFQKFSQKVLQ